MDKEQYYVIHGYGTSVTVCKSLEEAKAEYLQRYNSDDDSIAIAKSLPVTLEVKEII